MVLLNREDFKIYDLDSDDSIIDRIAYKENTLPVFLYFLPDGVINVKSTFINVINLLTIINSFTDFTELYKNINTKLNKNFNITYVLHIWILNQSWLNNLEISLKNSIFLEMETNIKKIPGLENIVLNDLWYNKLNLDIEILQLKRKVRILIDEFEEFDNISGEKYTEFELNKTTFDVKLTSENISILEIFNKMILNDFCPLAVIKDFYKINKDFKIIFDKKIDVSSDTLTDRKKEWLHNYIFSSDTSINVKVLQTKHLTPTSTYTDINIRIEDNYIFIQFEYNYSFYNISKQELIDRLFTIFEYDTIILYSNVISIDDIKINGVFYIPNNTLNKYIFSDMLLNNNLFSSLIYVDDHENASTVFNNIYIHINHQMLGELTVNITGKIMNIYDQNMKGKKEIEFPKNSKYIRIKVKNSYSLDIILKFQVIMSKIFALYKTKFTELYTIYRTYIPDFSLETTIIEIVKETSKVEKSKKLRDIVPDLFINNYQRYNCPNINELDIIPDEDVEQYKNDTSREVMKYPREDTIINFPNSNSKQRNYICNSDINIYPGVSKNSLSNKDIYPFVPCCYISNQKTKKKSKYREYFEGEVSKQSVKTNINISNKFVTNSFATLPENIYKTFELFETESAFYEFLRLGVKDDKNSFLRCILSCLDVDETNEFYSDMIKAKNGEDLNDIRQSLSSFAEACRQEQYNYTDNEIREKILDINFNFDPLLFVRIVEIKYNCNVFIFSRNDENISSSLGELILPNHKHSYIKEYNSNPSFFIFYHYGSESDMAEYPRCEIILKIKRNNGVDTLNLHERSSKYISIFDKNDPISIGIQNMFNELNMSYNINNKLGKYYIPNLIYTMQKIDSYGKTRVLTVKHNNENINLITRPIQPLNIPENKQKNISKTILPLALHFIRTNNFTIISQTVINNVVKEINIFIENFTECLIQIKNTSTNKPLRSIIVQSYINFPDMYEKSILLEYNMLKKIAGYMVEYVLWMFSNYIHKRNLIISNLVISTFIDTYIEIDTTFQYKDDVPKIFSIEKNNGILRDGKIIANTQLIKDRLKYNLHFNTVRYNQNVIDYYLKIVIDKYYINVTDFDQHKYQVIIEGKDSLVLWNNSSEVKIKYVIYTSIPIKDFSTYFFKNKNINNGMMYLAQPSNSLLEAINISKTWNESGYNIGINSKERNLHDSPHDRSALEQEELSENEIPFYKIYKYIDSNNITTDDIQSSLKIIEYKSEDNGTNLYYYISLLNLMK